MGWPLHCAWCGFYIYVNNRGMRKASLGSGFEASKLMEEHVAQRHQKTWQEYLIESRRTGIGN